MNLSELPDTTRLWIYASQRPLTSEEQLDITSAVNAFLPSWAYHGDALYAAFEILYDRFLVLALNEEKARAGGCAIDKSIHLFQEVEHRYQLDLFNRMRIALQTPDGIVMRQLHEVESDLKKGILDPNTPVYDTSLYRLGDIRLNWPCPLKETWVARRMTGVSGR
jgi:hypothetical protein